MKKTIIMITIGLLAALMVVGCGKKQTENTAPKKEEPKEPEYATIGVQDDGALEILLTNGTGAAIKSFVVNNSTTTEQQPNLLEDGDLFADGETRKLYYLVPDMPDPQAGEEVNAEEAQTDRPAGAGGEQTDGVASAGGGENATEDADTPAPKETPVEYTLVLTFEDGKQVKLHQFPMLDMKEGTLKREDPFGYVVYKSESTGEEINTLDSEKAILAAAQEAARAKAEAEQKAKEEAEAAAAAAAAQAEANRRWQQQQQAAAAAAAQQQQQQAAQQVPADNGCLGGDALTY